MYGVPPYAGAPPAQYGAPGPVHTSPGMDAIQAAGQTAQPYPRPATSSAIRTLVVQNISAATPNEPLHRSFRQVCLHTLEPTHTHTHTE